MGDSLNSRVQISSVCSIINYKFNEAASVKGTYLIFPRLKLSVGCYKNTLMHCKVALNLMKHVSMKTGTIQLFKELIKVS